MKTTLLFEDISYGIRTFPFPEVDAVVGIARGGKWPAVLVAYQLGLPLCILPCNYRDDANQPRFDTPQIGGDLPAWLQTKNKLLLVDDVAVSGSTLRRVKGLLHGFTVQTFVLKGKADFVLFPAISTCVQWPWAEWDTSPFFNP
jgi:hypoxanthine phosphoribosyltransferase